MTECPYCDEDIETQIHQEWVGDYPTFFDFECPKCGGELEIDVEMEPIFIAHKKSVCCKACSKAGGAEMPVYHEPPVCGEPDEAGREEVCEGK